MSATLRVIPLAFVNFCAYLGVGLPIAVLPLHVRYGLGLGDLAAGSVVSIQFLGTMASRPLVGRMADRIGPRRTTLLGMIATIGSGLLTLLSLALPVEGGLAVLVAGRLLMGFGESCAGTGHVLWNLGRLGPRHSTTVFAWGGIAAYGAIAAGTPLGALLNGLGGLGLVACGVVLFGLAGLGVSLCFAAVPVVGGARAGSGEIARRVLPYGLALSLGSLGFGAIASFGVLMFDARAWGGGALAVTAFGISFVAVRLGLAPLVARFGGRRVATGALLVEAVGLALFALAPTPVLAFLGAVLAGLGFGPVFPALAEQLMKGLPTATRGAAVGFYTLFLDLSLAVAGPLAALALDPVGYAGVFLMASLAAVAGAALSARRRAAA